MPQHGRTHQLRQHCARGLKASIAGDNKYGGTETGHGLLLAAIEYKFAHPITGEPMSFSMEEPARFEALRQQEAEVLEASVSERLKRKLRILAHRLSRLKVGSAWRG
mmetsp:Transcript_41086/g.64169  ORF Transcript_41086/g.64169 Transcript_41086/m.64169 type:complete len:107 (-) Transcript_41086:119-439(-)